MIFFSGLFLKPPPTLNAREKAYLPLATVAAERHGIPRELLYGIVRIESAWRPDAKNETGGDLRRGGAYGLGQMTIKTASNLLGWTGTDSELREKLLEPGFNLDTTAQLLASESRRFNGVLRDIISAYNSGKNYANAPTSTRTVYVPKVLAFMRDYEGLRHG